MVTDSIETRNSIAVFFMVVLFVKNKIGTKTKATKYQHFANRNFNEISQSVDERTVTIIHSRLQSKRITRGCLAFAAISEGLKRTYETNRAVISHMIGSSGRSVDSEELKLNSTDHGKAIMSRQKIICRCCHPA